MPLPRHLLIITIISILLTSGCISDQSQQSNQTEPPLPPPIPALPAEGNAVASDQITGMTPHSTYSGFAEPETFTLPTAYTFSSTADTDTISLTINDDYIYRYVLISYGNNPGWNLKDLEGDYTTHYITDSATISIDISPDDFGLTTPGQVVSKNYIVTYTCDSTFYCHDGWQIRQFDASIEEPSPPTWQEGLLAWWKLDGDATDSAGANDGTVSGAVPTSTDCVYGGCYVFDGSDDKIDVGVIPVPGNKGSMSLWLKADDTDGWRYGIGRYWTQHNIGQRDDSDYFTGSWTSDGETWGGIESDVPVDNEWHHIVLTYDGDPGGDNLKMYVDGSLSSSKDMSGETEGNSEPWQIGAHGNDWDFWSGSIDEVMIHDRLLSATEVAAMYAFFTGTTCEPDCTGKECGPDGCGETCPPGCTYPETCISGECIISDVIGTIPHKIHLNWDDGDATDTSMVVVWREGDEDDPISALYYDTLSRACNIQSYAYSMPSTGTQMTDTNDYIRHAKVTGLSPDTIYYFCIGNSAGTSDEYSFRTAPSSGTDFTFVMGGDTQYTVTGSDYEILTGHLMEREPLFVLHSGDGPDNSYESDWDNWLDEMQENFVTPSGRMVPIIPAVGNHDISGDSDRSFWHDYYILPNDELHFYHDIGDLRVITLYLPGGEDSVLNIDDQAAYLEEKLTEATGTGKWILTQYHMPFYPTYRSVTSTTTKARNVWGSLFDQYHVQASLEGHDHIYKRTYPLNGNSIVSEGEGTVYLGDGTWVATRSGVNSANEWALEVYKESFMSAFVGSFSPGRMHVEAIDIDGNTHDEVYIPKGVSDEIQQLEVSSNGRFLIKEDGTPFFYLGDTAWRMPMILTREEVDLYMETRKEQGFNVIMITLEGTTFGEEDIQNAYGHSAYLNNDFTTPRVVPGDDNDYWDHLDYIVDKAEELGLYIALMPIWSNSYYLSENECRTVGEFVGTRYDDKENIIWIMGGDDNPDGKEQLFRAMAEEITMAITGSTSDSNDQVLITYHPCGWYESLGYPHTSSEDLHDETWLDMNGIQSGHWDMQLGEPPALNYKYVEIDYALSPAKPTAEMESFYEGHYFENNPSSRRGDDYDVRRNAYWSVFAGGFGYTFGNNNVWPFYLTSSGTSETYCDTNWYDALDSVGANDMIHLKNLMFSRGYDGYLNRIPDQSMITSGNPDSLYYMYATRSSDGSYAFIYIPEEGKSVTINTGILSGSTLHVWWYNPRDGSHIDDGTVSKTSSQTFTTPTTSGPDWVLVLDDNSKGFGPPG